jgi:glycosyltransferase involved in cell wall biosynthesis
VSHVNEVITVNDSIAAELQRRHRLARQPTVVMNCPVHGQVPETSGRQTGGEQVSLLYHGAFTAGRGLEGLVRAMVQVDDRATLLLRGDGPLHGTLQQIARDAGLEQRIHFTPPVPPDQLVASMAGCSVGIVPYLPTSLNNYLCTPNKIFEYMMGGLAVVATDLPELRRIVAGSGAGMLYTPSDGEGLARAVNALIRDPEVLARCRAAARRAALDTYNWESQAEKLRRLYAELLESR